MDNTLPPTLQAIREAIDDIYLVSQTEISDQFPNLAKELDYAHKIREDFYPVISNTLMNSDARTLPESDTLPFSILVKQVAERIKSSYASFTSINPIDAIKRITQSVEALPILGQVWLHIWTQHLNSIQREVQHREQAALIEDLRNIKSEALQFAEQNEQRITQNMLQQVALEGKFRANQAELSESVKNLAEAEAKLNETIATYNEQAPKFEDALRKSNSVGMREAFNHRATVTLLNKIGWGISLAVTLWAIYSNGASLLTAIDLANAVSKTSSQSGIVFESNIYSILARAFLAFPLIWWAWFSAKQYGYTSRIQDDYDFKVAVARSYEAYKKEAEADPVAKAKLLESAFSTFADNPLRIYNIPSDPGSPAQEILESVSKMDKVLDALKKK
jgi:hypothetical protein